MWWVFNSTLQRLAGFSAKPATKGRLDPYGFNRFALWFEGLLFFVGCLAWFADELEPPDVVCYELWGTFGAEISGAAHERVLTE
jgi:hypothetical protein